MAPSLICGGPGGQHLHSAGSYHLQLPQGPLIPGHLTVPGQKVGMAAVLEPLEGLALTKPWPRLGARQFLAWASDFNLTPVGELPPLSEMCFPYVEIHVRISVWELLCR